MLWFGLKVAVAGWQPDFGTPVVTEVMMLERRPRIGNGLCQARDRAKPELGQVRTVPRHVGGGGL